MHLHVMFDLARQPTDRLLFLRFFISRVDNHESRTQFDVAFWIHLRSASNNDHVNAEQRDRSRKPQWHRTELIQSRVSEIRIDFCCCFLLLCRLPCVHVYYISLLARFTFAANRNVNSVCGDRAVCVCNVFNSRRFVWCAALSVPYIPFLVYVALTFWRWSSFKFYLIHSIRFRVDSVDR